MKVTPAPLMEQRDPRGTACHTLIEHSALGRLAGPRDTARALSLCLTFSINYRTPAAAPALLPQPAAPGPVQRALGPAAVALAPRACCVSRGRGGESPFEAFDGACFSAISSFATRRVRVLRKEAASRVVCLDACWRIRNVSSA
ncbi:hypothetical protein SRHO_G00307380 [Serrasalmus rhombeus]